MAVVRRPTHCACRIDNSLCVRAPQADNIDALSLERKAGGVVDYKHLRQHLSPARSICAVALDHATSAIYLIRAHMTLEFSA